MNLKRVLISLSIDQSIYMHIVPVLPGVQRSLLQLPPMLVVFVHQQHARRKTAQLVHNQMSLIYSSPIHPPTHSLTHPPTHSSPTHPPIHPPTYSLTHPPTDSLTHSLIHPPTHSLTHPLTHLLTHSLTHSPTYTHPHLPTAIFD